MLFYAEISWKSDIPYWIQLKTILLYAGFSWKMLFYAKFSSKTCCFMLNATKNMLFYAENAWNQLKSCIDTEFSSTICSFMAQSAENLNSILNSAPKEAFVSCWNQLKTMLLYAGISREYTIYAGLSSKRCCLRWNEL